MDFIIKFAQIHETFRLPEIEAIAATEKLDLQVLDYKNEVSCHRNRHKPRQLTEIVTALQTEATVCQGRGTPRPEIDPGAVYPRVLGTW